MKEPRPFSLDALLPLLPDDKSAGELLGLGRGENARQNFQRLKQRGCLTVVEADRFATGLGLHPLELWSDWYEAEERERARIRTRLAKRDRRAVDVELREREREYMRAYQADNRDAINAQRRDYYRRNRRREIEANVERRRQKRLAAA